MEFRPDGSLYVAEMIKNGLFRFFTAGDTVGALWQVKGASKSELAPGELHVLADVAVARNGTVDVTTGSVFPDGAVMRINHQESGAGRDRRRTPGARNRRLTPTIRS